MEILRLFINWLKRKSGKPIVDYVKKAGYYLPTGLMGAKLEGREEIWEMESGRKAKFRLLEFSRFSDPDDMVKESKWQLIGYVGEKPLAEMTFNEYRQEFKRQRNHPQRG